MPEAACSNQTISQLPVAPSSESESDSDFHPSDLTSDDALSSPEKRVAISYNMQKRMKIDGDANPTVRPIELPLKYHIAMTSQLEDFIDRINQTRQCKEEGCSESVPVKHKTRGSAEQRKYGLCVMVDASHKCITQAVNWPCYVGGRVWVSSTVGVFCGKCGGKSSSETAAETEEVADASDDSEDGDEESDGMETVSETETEETKESSEDSDDESEDSSEEEEDEITCPGKTYCTRQPLTCKLHALLYDIECDKVAGRGCWVSLDERVLSLMSLPIPDGVDEIWRRENEQRMKVLTKQQSAAVKTGRAKMKQKRSHERKKRQQFVKRQKIVHSYGREEEDWVDENEALAEVQKRLRASSSRVDGLREVAPPEGAIVNTGERGEAPVSIQKKSNWKHFSEKNIAQGLSSEKEKVIFVKFIMLDYTVFSSDIFLFK
ncbi:hypothetical protein ACROYT_G015178 [Oculina patagonica]